MESKKSQCNKTKRNRKFTSIHEFTYFSVYRSRFESTTSLFIMHLGSNKSSLSSSNRNWHQALPLTCICTQSKQNHGWIVVTPINESRSERINLPYQNLDTVNHQRLPGAELFLFSFSDSLSLHLFLFAIFNILACGCCMKKSWLQNGKS